MDIANFLLTLPIIAKGLVGIFAVTAVVVLAVMALNSLTSRKGGE